MSEAEKLHRRPDAPLKLAQMRVDGRRDTRIMVQRNVSGDVHITLGSIPMEFVMILHPHMATRLAKNIQEVLGGAEFVYE
jgi:hypothetical protein